MLKRSVVLDIFPISEKLDSRTVRSASEYVILYQLTRGLVSISKDGCIQESLAKSWQVSENHTKIEFLLKDTERFSNGDLITAKDFVDTILWQQKNMSAIHVEFRQINKVFALDNARLTIWLNEPNPRFLEKLCHVEFGVLHSSDTNECSPSYQISSGYYYLSELKKNSAILIRNKFVSTALNSFDEVHFQSTCIEQIIEGFKSHQVDFAVSYADSEKRFSQLIISGEKIEKFKPHIGFTYWISLKPSSKIFKDHKNRAKIFSLIKDVKTPSDFESPYEVADQLYLPDGPGRLSSEEIQSIRLSLSKLNTSFSVHEPVKVLVPANLSFAKIIQRLNAGFTNISVESYSNQDDFVKKNTSNIDMFIANNDFSSLDVGESIFVVFNKNRPLIYTNDKIESLFTRVNSESIDENRYDLYHAISKALLTDALIVPLFYDRINFYHSNRLDLSEWSVLFPEIAVWKIKEK